MAVTRVRRDICNERPRHCPVIIIMYRGTTALNIGKRRTTPCGLRPSRSAGLVSRGASVCPSALYTSSASDMSLAHPHAHTGPRVYTPVRAYTCRRQTPARI
ncbi:hypothetical protein EVAR_22745_1 [Eumeta japonica]|uniref:Uncharacterized protein n=1 Tax=Eumeta variegata TaxID=151549 RepID=A0A4C1USC3_EUMVA|nr:hypothetical protein EVAR_22745_1 [Eumeta japonica]